MSLYAQEINRQLGRDKYRSLLKDARSERLASEGSAAADKLSLRLIRKRLGGLAAMMAGRLGSKDKAEPRPAGSPGARHGSSRHGETPAS